MQPRPAVNTPTSGPDSTKDTKDTHLPPPPGPTSHPYTLPCLLEDVPSRHVAGGSPEAAVWVVHRGRLCRSPGPRLADHVVVSLVPRHRPRHRVHCSAAAAAAGGGGGGVSGADDLGDARMVA